MNARKILSRTAVTGALVAVPLVAVVGTASADPIRDEQGHQQAQSQSQWELPQFQLPNPAPAQPVPTPAPAPAPTDLPNFAPGFFQGLSTGSSL
ncbi:hypothetical protein [Rhodococcoides fascians]|uniref:hypothetical protein n=1 Tax=Rhodococcoides fascians TaxID=1828 RepID=UPI00055C4D01|nr:MULTISPECIES: hypothetical protein [Rhodococcus]OZE98035.1 hypothetical protein CH301_16930 [Rhodococcus sp. 15-1189-1-1a]OZF12685.1 hypothetical protein CH299_17615 [Rhodococcus sp. 14-2686-1-2]